MWNDVTEMRWYEYEFQLKGAESRYFDGFFFWSEYKIVLIKRNLKIIVF